MLAGSDFAGHVVLEVTHVRARTKAERDGLLAESLESPALTGCVRSAGHEPGTDPAVLRM